MNTETTQAGCDKGSPTSLCNGIIAMATCGKCGKVYHRCLEHGSAKGAARSLGAHKGLIHYGESR